MGRYRPPQVPGSKYITPEGYDRLQDELDFLWRVERPKITQSVQEAAAQGDRSENAEYIYGKKQLREIDRRIRFLRKRLDEMTVVDTRPTDTSRVYFGAWVTLEDDGGNTVHYRIVGPDEISAEKSYISMDSPVAKALMGKKVEDCIAVTTPKNEINYSITKISYSG